MRIPAFLTLALLLSATASAQVRVRQLPESGYEQRIRDFVDQIRVIDTHEHLLDPATFDPSMLDFTLLLRHYAAGDLGSAGIPWPTLETLMGDSISVTAKWKILEPYWEASSNTGYNRAALLAAERLFGIQDINEATVQELSDRIKKAYQTDWYDQVLIKHCGIECVIEDYPFDDWENRITGQKGMFRYVRKFDSFILIGSRDDIRNLEKWNRSGINTLDDLVAALELAFNDAVKQNIVAVKSILAYNRTLSYANPSEEEARKVFSKIMNFKGEVNLPYAEVKPLQDFMMHRVLDLADAHHLPVQLHTGLNGGNIEMANPTHLINLFNDYPDLTFILFHGAYPYGGEVSVLAKKFKNVYIDLCWTYIISPSWTERYLHEWLETVPASKIMAFGGDFLYVENVFSHLLFAREIVSNVLVDKVKDGYFNESEAMKIAQMLFHDNAVRILGLDK